MRFVHSQTVNTLEYTLTKHGHIISTPITRDYQTQTAYLLMGNFILMNLMDELGLPIMNVSSHSWTSLADLFMGGWNITPVPADGYRRVCMTQVNQYGGIRTSATYWVHWERGLVILLQPGAPSN